MSVPCFDGPKTLIEIEPVNQIEKIRNRTLDWFGLNFLVIIKDAWIEHQDVFIIKMKR